MAGRSFVAASNPSTVCALGLVNAGIFRGVFFLAAGAGLRGGMKANYEARWRRATRRLRLLVMQSSYGVIVLSVLAAACGGAECFAVPCAQPLALSVSVVSNVDESVVPGAVVETSGGTISSQACQGTCVVPGSAGTYNVKVTAPSFKELDTVLVVTGTTPSCGCPTVDERRLVVKLLPSP